MDYIKISRKILEWEWWDDINTSRLFLYMLLKANWKDGKFKGLDIPRGSFVSSISKLSDGTHLTVDEVRTALKHLKETGEITSKPHSKFTVFTIKNYGSYQDVPKQDAEQMPNSSQAIPILFPTIEEKKEGKKDILCAAEPHEKPADKDEQLMHDFEIIYGIYPKKRGRTAAFAEYKRWVSREGKDVSGKRYRLTNRQIYLAVKKYVQQQEDAGQDDYQYWKNFDTLMGRQLLDYVDFEEGKT